MNKSISILECPYNEVRLAYNHVLDVISDNCWHQIESEMPFELYPLKFINTHIRLLPKNYIVGSQAVTDAILYFGGVLVHVYGPHALSVVLDAHDYIEFVDGE